MCTHGILSEPAIERLNDSPIKEIILTNSIDLSDKRNKYNMDKFTVYHWQNFLVMLLIVLIPRVQ